MVDKNIAITGYSPVEYTFSVMDGLFLKKNCNNSVSITSNEGTQYFIKDGFIRIRLLLLISLR